jgi:energy-converting hydrogenase Eha subunit C
MLTDFGRLSFCISEQFILPFLQQLLSSWLVQSSQSTPWVKLPVTLELYLSAQALLQTNPIDKEIHFSPLSLGWMTMIAIGAWLKVASVLQPWTVTHVMLVVMN